MISRLDTQTPTEIYGSLRVIASRALGRERRDHTLQPTALAHEVYLRVAADARFQNLDCPGLLAVASHVVRAVLVDHARRRNALKRGGGCASPTSLDEVCALYEERAVDLVALDDALGRLAQIDADSARIVEMRFFGGLTEREIADELGISNRTVRRSWAAARTWLARELSPT